MMTDLYIPPGSASMVEVLEEDPHVFEKFRTLEGEFNLELRYRLKSKRNGRQQVLRILVDESTSRWSVDTLLGEAVENFDRENAYRPAQRVPSKAERLEVGAALRQIRESAQKRQESSNGVVYYPIGG